MPTQAAAPIARRDVIEGLGKGLRVIEAFDDDHPRLTASEAGALAGITRTAPRRHLLSLVHFGYAATDGKQFWLAPRVRHLGQSYLGAARPLRLVQPFIQRVSMAAAKPSTPACSTATRCFHADVRSAHEQGYWATGQQLDAALRGISVALLDRKGACRGAIGCTAPAASYTQRQLIDKLLPLLCEAAQALQSLL